MFKRGNYCKLVEVSTETSEDGGRGAAGLYRRRVNKQGGVFRCVSSREQSEDGSGCLTMAQNWTVLWERSAGAPGKGGGCWRCSIVLLDDGDNGCG